MLGQIVAIDKKNQWRDETRGLWLKQPIAYVQIDGLTEVTVNITERQYDDILAAGTELYHEGNYASFNPIQWGDVFAEDRVP